MKTFVRSWLPVLAAFAIGASFVGISGAHRGSGRVLHSSHNDSMNGTLTAKGFKYTNPKTGILAVGTGAFSPVMSGCFYDTASGNGQGFLHSSGSCDYHANVALPQGARITRVRWSYDTPTTTGDAVLRLEANNDLSSGGGGTDLVQLDADDACTDTPCIANDSSVPTVAGANPVNNANRHYTLYLEATGGSFRWSKVLVYYTVKTPGT